MSEAPKPESTRRALVFVYAGYAFRYLYLLILVPFYGRVLGPGEYGRLLAAMSLFQLVWMLAEYGFPLVGVREIAGARDPRGLGQSYGEHTMGRLVTLGPALLLGIAGTVFSPVLSERPLFGVLATLNGVVAAFNLGWFFQGTLRFRTSVLLELLGFALNLSLILVTVRGADDGWKVLACLLFSSTLCTAIAHWVALSGLERATIRLRGGVGLVRRSSALFLHKGLTLMLASSSTFLISLTAPATEVGFYGAAERLVTVGLSLLQPANQVLVGKVSRQIGSPEESAAAYGLMRKGLVVLTSFGFLMFAGSELIASVVVPLVLGPSFVPSVPMLRILSVMFPFAALCQVIAGYILIPLRLDAEVSRSSLIGAVVTVGLILGMGHAWSGIGVAWARTLGQVLMAGLLLDTLRRRQLFQRVLGA